MKANNSEIEQYRIKVGSMGSDVSYGNNGAFLIPFKTTSITSENIILNIITSDQMGWDHVSVSLKDRVPTWEEMCFIKNLFWNDEETVIQYHPAKSKYVNCCDFCLHLWKKQGGLIELPPGELI